VALWLVFTKLSLYSHWQRHNLIPRVLSFPSPLLPVSLSLQGTGRRGPWERGWQRNKTGKRLDFFSLYTMVWRCKNGAKQTLRKLDAVTFQGVKAFEPTNGFPLPKLLLVPSVRMIETLKNNQNWPFSLKSANTGFCKQPCPVLLQMTVQASVQAASSKVVPGRQFNGHFVNVFHSKLNESCVLHIAFQSVVGSYQSWKKKDKTKQK